MFYCGKYWLFYQCFGTRQNTLAVNSSWPRPKGESLWETSLSWELFSQLSSHYKINIHYMELIPQFGRNLPTHPDSSCPIRLSSAARCVALVQVPPLHLQHSDSCPSDHCTCWVISAHCRRSAGSPDPGSPPRSPPPAGSAWGPACRTWSPAAPPPAGTVRSSSRCISPPGRWSRT